MEWLHADLETNRGAVHTFVFMHYPLYPKSAAEGFNSAAQRDALHALFVRYGVRNVFCGHEHLIYKSERDGVTYWVSGGAGAPNDAPPEEGGYQHYLQFTVDGEKVSANILQPWRLFARAGPAHRDGSASVTVANYNAVDLAVRVEMPFASAAAAASASWTYKGTSHPLTATVVPTATPGTVAVQVVVPKGRAAVVTVYRTSRGALGRSR
jgi:hypothetical protein